MTQDEIQAAARFAYVRGEASESLFHIMWNSQPSASIGWSREELIAFANAVAAKEQKKWEAQTAVEIHEAVLEEREACAKLCENSAGIIDAPSAFINGPSNSATRKAQCFADAIRARGQA